MSDLPQGWIEIPLEKLAGPEGLVTDGDWVESKDQDPNGEVRLIQLADVGVNEFRDRSERFLTSDKALELRCSFLEKGDVLIARMPDPIGRACVFPGLGQSAVTVVDVMLWRSDSALSIPAWLAFIMNSPDVRASILTETSGTTRQRISGGRLKALNIPTPPLAEQRRIVVKLNALDASSKRARADLDRIPALVARAKQAILAKAFSGELTADWRLHNSEKSVSALLDEIGVDAISSSVPLPRGWAWVLAGEICEVKGGLALGKKRSQDVELVEKPYLRVANVQRGWLTLDQIKTVLVTPDEARSLELKAGDILMNEGGDRDKLGRGWVWEGQIAGCIHQNHVFRLRLRSGKIEPKFISIYANAFGQDYFLDQGKQTTNLASISMSKIRALPLPLASPDEMCEIFHRIESAFAKIDRIAAEAASASKLLDRLDQALLSKAFRGELVPQDPDDEPASELLARIQSARAAAPKAKRTRKTKEKTP